MPPSPVTDRRRGSDGSPRPRSRPNASPRSDTPRWVWVVVAGALLTGVYLLYRRRQAQTGLSVTSGTPGPDLTGSAAQRAGGGGGVTGSLPTVLVTQPDPVQQQVQVADTTSAESPQAIAPDAGAGGPDTAAAAVVQQAAASPVVETPTSPFTIAGGLDPAIATAYQARQMAAPVPLTIAAGLDPAIATAYEARQAKQMAPAPAPLTIAAGLDPAIATAVNNPTPQVAQWTPSPPVLTQAQTQRAEAQAHAATVAAQHGWTAGF